VKERAQGSGRFFALVPRCRRGYPTRMIRVLISGSGKMGRAIADTVDAQADMTVSGVVDGLGEPATWVLASGGSVKLFIDADEAVREARPDVVVDFTNAAWTPVIAEAALRAGARPVIGTSGLSGEYLARLAAACAERQLGGVVAANFALGAVLMMHMARIAAKYFDSAEIVELHHDQKVDAPSGTAIATAQGMVEAHGGDFARNAPESTPIAHSRDAALGGVTIHSLRLPGLVAHQEVIFGGLGQTLTIRHDTTGRESFMPGILLAVREVMQRRELVVGLDRLIGLT